MSKRQIDIDKLRLFDSEKLEQISEGLPYGANKEIAKITGYHKETVSRVRHGKEYIPVILEALINLYEKNQKFDKRIRTKINRVLDRDEVLT